jgi:hypothetical protein
MLFMFLSGCCTTISITTTAQDQQAIDLVKNWTVAKYSYRGSIPGELGSLELKNEIVDHEGKKVLRFTDSYDVKRVLLPKGREPYIDAKYVALCQLDRYFTPISVKSEGRHYDRLKCPIDHRLVGGNWFGKYWVAGKLEESQRKVEPPLVLDLALSRIAATMPFMPGTALKFAFVSTEGDPETDHVLRCLGHESVEIGNTRFNAWKFEHPKDTLRTDTFWISEDRRLLKAELAAASGDQFIEIAE